MMDDLTRNVLEQRDNIENQRNRELNSNREEYIKQLQQENQALKEKYLNAVADYEYEKSKNQRVIEYINVLLLDFYDYECERLIVGKYMINDLLEILKEDNKEE